MKYLIAGMAALSFFASPVLAQDTQSTDTGSNTMAPAKPAAHHHAAKHHASHCTCASHHKATTHHHAEKSTSTTKSTTGQ